ncbi:hypothetical protein [Burkholderia gladioli]|uniref:hypothetical protein n=1 Tax=Burkholderia gladioli TaxID=28095 RepID=UPI001560B312|nr:hypothetical protein [Burkholderia gladioli]NRF83115.1 hypothetical protein [Burkholderia gladioli]
MDAIIASASLRLRFGEGAICQLLVVASGISKCGWHVVSARLGPVLPGRLDVVATQDVMNIFY